MAIAKVFYDVPMGLGLPGLTELARQKRTRVGDGKFLLFMNRKRTKVKILFDEFTLFMYSKPSGTITTEELQNLPAVCKGEWVTDSIANQLERWLNSPITPVASMVKAA